MLGNLYRFGDCEVLSLVCVRLLCFAYRATTSHTLFAVLVRGIPLAIWSLYFSSGHPSMPGSEKRAASQLADWLGACSKPPGALRLQGSGARRTGQEDQETPHHPEHGRHAGERVLRDVGRRSGHLGRLHTQGATAMGKDSLLEATPSRTRTGIPPDWESMGRDLRAFAREAEQEERHEVLASLSARSTMSHPGA